jgi:enoyl-CoA hydratase/carnithine racemase
VYEHLLYSSEDGVTTITLNRPDKRNAINTPLAEELEAAWVAFEASADRVAILAGS